MAQRTAILTHAEEVAAPADGFGEVLTQMLWTAVVLFGIATALTLALGGT